MPGRSDRPVTEAYRPHRHRVGHLVGRIVQTPAGALGATLLLLALGLSLLADVLAPGDPFAASGPALRPPSGAHLMGTDNFGRDIAGAVVHGMRTSMAIVGVVGAMTLIIGLVVGLTSGFLGGWPDDLLVRVTEVFQSIPQFFLALLVVAFFGAGLDNLILLLGATSWMLSARVVRAATLAVREREFIEVARSSGGSTLGLVLRHVLPNVLPAALVTVVLVGSRVILIEAALSFIGLGDPNQVSLGYLIASAQPFLRVAWWMSVFPGAAIVVAVLGLNLTGDLVNDSLDPTRRLVSPRRRIRRNRPRVTASDLPGGLGGAALDLEPVTGGDGPRR